MSELRILHVTSCADPIGGAERYVYAIEEAQRARGFETFVFGTSPDREIDKGGLRVVRRPPFIPEELFGDRTVTNALDETLGAFRPDVVHIHNLYGLPLTIETRLADQDCAMLQTVHDYSTLCPNSWCVRGDGRVCPGGAGDQCFRHSCGDNYPFTPEIVLYTKLRQSLLQQLLDAAVAPSTALVERLRENGFPDVRQLPYFIEPRHEDTSAEVDPDLVLFVGRLDLTKGVRYLVDAMPHVIDRHASARLALVGTGPEHDALKAQVAARGLESCITFHGSLGYEEVAAFMRRAACIVVPSIWSENSPLTLYECMDAGLPAVGSRIGGIPDLVVDGETGLVAEPRDPEDIGRKIADLLTDPAVRNEMAERQRARVREFSREESVDRLTIIYQEIIQRRLADSDGARRGVSSIDRDLLTIISRLTGNASATASERHPDAAASDVPGEVPSPAASATAPPAETGLRALAKRFLSGKRSDA